MKVYLTFTDDRSSNSALCVNGSLTSRGVDPELLEDWINEYGELKVCIDLESRTAAVLIAGGGNEWGKP